MSLTRTPPPTTPPAEPAAVPEAAPPLRKRARRRWIRRGLALVNLVLGVVGLFFPVIQGVLHLVIGLALLAPDLRAARRLTLAIYRRWPRLRRGIPGWLRRMTRRNAD